MYDKKIQMIANLIKELGPDEYFRAARIVEAAAKAGVGTIWLRGAIDEAEKYNYYGPSRR